MGSFPFQVTATTDIETSGGSSNMKFGVYAKGDKWEASHFRVLTPLT